MKMLPRSRVLLTLFLVFLTIGCDRVSKNVVRNTLEEQEIIPVVKDTFILTRVENTGAAMSLGEGFSPAMKTVFLKVLPAVLLTVMLVVVLLKKDLPLLSMVGWASVIGGGIGNIYDRVLHNSVTDFMFIDLGGIFKTGIFNMADVSVTIGILLVIIQVLWLKRSGKLASKEHMNR